MTAQDKSHDHFEWFSKRATLMKLVGGSVVSIILATVAISQYFITRAEAEDQFTKTSDQILKQSQSLIIYTRQQYLISERKNLVNRIDDLTRWLTIMNATPNNKLSSTEKMQIEFYTDEVSSSKKKIDTIDEELEKWNRSAAQLEKQISVDR